LSLFLRVHPFLDFSPLPCFSMSPPPLRAQVSVSLPVPRITPFHSVVILLLVKVPPYICRSVQTGQIVWSSSLAFPSLLSFTRLANFRLTPSIRFTDGHSFSNSF